MNQGDIQFISIPTFESFQFFVQISNLGFEIIIFVLHLKTCRSFFDGHGQRR